MIKFDRLSRLAALLEGDAASKLGLQFNLGDWADATVTENEIRYGFMRWKSRIERNICRTSACAVGLACLSGEFKKDNLSFEECDGCIGPVYADKQNWDAVDLFFGLDREQSLFLFDEKEYDGPTVGPDAELIVAKRIRDFVKEKSKGKKKATAGTSAQVEKLKNIDLETVFQDS